MFDPHADLADRYPHIRVARCRIDGGARSAYLPGRDLILVSDQLDPASEASSLTHEGVHLDRGDRCGPVCTVLDAKRENAVDRAAAIRQIPWGRLKQVLQVDQDEHMHAQELGVDVETLRIRIEQTLTDRQREELAALVANRSAWGAA